MKTDGKNSTLYSWPVIILIFILFWPVGLFLIIKKVSIDRKAGRSIGGQALKGIGIGLTVFGVIGFIGCVSDPEAASGVVVAILFIAGGIALIFKGKKRCKEEESIKQYLAVIVNGNVLLLDSIAAATGKSYDVVKADVQKMIQKGCLKNAYINESTREIVISASAPSGCAEESGFVQPTQTTAKKVTCPCCGANNTIYGGSGACEYCGSPIQ